MKFALALLAFAPTLASAAPGFYCKSAAPAPGRDLAVNFSASMQHADISTGPATGRQIVAELACSYMAIPEGQKNPELPYLSCAENRPGHGGYTVLLRNSGGQILATVYQGKLGRPLTNLACGRN